MLEFLFCLFGGLVIIVTGLTTFIAIAISWIFPIIDAIVTFIFKLFGLM